MDRLIKEDSPDSPDPELEALSTADSLSVAHSEENIIEETNGKRTPGRKTPSGRSRTPIFGKHRNRHKSTGSSPAPSLKSHGTTTAAIKSPKLCHQRTLSQPEVTSPTSSQAAKGEYEPVGKDRIQNSQSVGKLPQSRPPDSQLPTIPNDGDDSDTTESCFPLRKSRSRSRERKTKKISARSQSRDSRWSDPDHPYETPKLLPKHQRREEDRRSKSHQDMSLVEYGYEPIGRPRADLVTKPEDEGAAINIDEKLSETDTILHLSRHNDGDSKTTTSVTETKQGRNLLNNLIDKVKKLSKDESQSVIKRKDSKEEKTAPLSTNDKDHPAVCNEQELNSKEITEAEALLKVKEEQEEERRKKEVQETEKRAQKDAEKQLKEEQKKNKKEQERDMRQAQEQEKKRLKDEAKVLKREQDAEQLRLRKLKEEQEKIVKREKEEQLKQQKIKEEEEKQIAKRLKKAEEIEQKNQKKEKEKQEKQLKKEKEDILRQQKLKEEEERNNRKIREDEQRKKLVKAEKEEEEMRLRQVREQTKKRENDIRVHKDPEDKTEPVYADEVPLK